MISSEGNFFVPCKVYFVNDIWNIYEIKVYFVGWFWDPNQKQSFPDTDNGCDMLNFYSLQWV